MYLPRESRAVNDEWALCSCDSSDGGINSLTGDEVDEVERQHRSRRQLHSPFALVAAAWLMIGQATRRGPARSSPTVLEAFFSLIPASPICTELKDCKSCVRKNLDENNYCEWCLNNDKCFDVYDSLSLSCLPRWIRSRCPGSSFGTEGSEPMIL